jgi:dihydrofolate reductase
VEGIRKIKEQDGKNIVLWGSISLAQSLIKENLVDEYRIQLCPTIIGGGKQLFPSLSSYKNVKLISLRK